MGGMGSGRRYHPGAKELTDNYRSIDIRCWQKEGLLSPNKCFGWNWSRHGEVVASIHVRAETEYLILNYKHKSSRGYWSDHTYSICLDWTACHLGGKRVWFLCPASGCHRRVAILYGANRFACRHCYQLTYPSQRESVDNRAANRADKIRKKLGWKPGILNDNGWKPKGMHWKTFDRLTAKHDAFVNMTFIEMEAQLDIQKQRVIDCFDKF